MIISSGDYAGIEIFLLFRHNGYQHGVGNGNVKDTATLYFEVRGAADEETAVAAVGSSEASTATQGGVVPAAYANTVPRSEIKVEDRIREDRWIVAVGYALNLTSSRNCGNLRIRTLPFHALVCQ